MNRLHVLIAAILSLVIGVNAKTISLSIENANATIENDTIQAVVDKEPEFPGGDAARIKFIQQNIKYPEDAQQNKLEGKVNIQFVVSSTGHIIQAKVVKKLAPSLDEEALRIIKSFPRWIPGEIKGKKVPVYRVMQVSFKYTPVENAEDNWQITDSTLIVIDSIKLPLKFNLEVINKEQIDTVFVLKPFPENTRDKLIAQYGQSARDGVLLLKTYDIMNLRIDTSNCKIVDDRYTYKDVSKMPQFIGGEKALLNYVSKHLQYPVYDAEIGHQGKVIVQFIIDRSGKVRNSKILSSASSGLDREALRVVSEMPDWIPGEINGEKVNFLFQLPISYMISGEYSKRSSNVRFDSLQLILDGQILPKSFKINWLDYSKLTSLKTIVPKKQKEKNELIDKYGTTAANGVIIAISKRENPVPKVNISDNDSLGNKIYSVVEQMPEYPGGDAELIKFMQKNLIYPKADENKHIQGYVTTIFVVNALGKTEQAQVIRSLSPECDKEALRVVKLLTNWIPGKQNGVPVSVRYSVPIKFVSSSGNIAATSSLDASDRKAEYPGGFKALYSYLVRNIKYPVESALNDQKGQILVRFTVNEQGQVDSVDILTKINETATILETIVVTAMSTSNSEGNNMPQHVTSPEKGANYLEKEAISLVKSMPKWIPAKKDGQTTSETFILPILFMKNSRN